MDERRLENVRSQLRSIRSNLQELEDRRATAVAANQAAQRRTHQSAPVEARLGAVQAQLQTALAELEGLHTAMRTRAVIEQAKGMLMLTLDVDVDAEVAFEQLRRESNRSNLRLVEVAENVVARRSGRLPT